MKKKSPPWPIIGAVVLGILGIIFLVHWKNAQDQAAAAALAAQKAELQKEIDDLNAKQQVVVATTPTNMRKVLYATQPVDAGVKISSAFFETKLTPDDILPDAFTDQSDIVGFYAVRRIEKGDPLTPRNIGKSLPYMSQRISPGMRAISLPIFNAQDNQTGGFVVDGDKVDLLFTTQSKDHSVQLQTQMLMQNLSVLYVPGPTIKTDKTDGINPAPPPGEPIAVTFEVTPEQAQALIFLQGVQNGQFSMILKYRGDHSEIKIKPFAGDDYNTLDSLKKIQTMADRSEQRVQLLAQKIAEAEKAQAPAQAPQGNTNETPTPTPQ